MILMIYTVSILHTVHLNENVLLSLYLDCDRYSFKILNTEYCMIQIQTCGSLNIILYAMRSIIILFINVS